MYIVHTIYVLSDKRRQIDMYINTYYDILFVVSLK